MRGPGVSSQGSPGQVLRDDSGEVGVQWDVQNPREEVAIRKVGGRPHPIRTIKNRKPLVRYRPAPPRQDRLLRQEPMVHSPQV
jgi:hypothetical protein